MLYEIKTEIIKLGCNFTFSRNLLLTIVVVIFMLCGLAELQSQNNQLTEQNLITNVSNSSTKVIVERK